MTSNRWNPGSDDWPALPVCFPRLPFCLPLAAFAWSVAFGVGGPGLSAGGACGLSVFVTLPEPEDPIWSLRWNDFQHMKPRDWVMLVGLAFSGCVGGCAAGLTRRFPRVNGGGWNASDLGTRQQR